MGGASRDAAGGAAMNFPTFSPSLKDIRDRDSVELRADRIRAYHAGRCRFAPPPVYTGNWNEESWCNWVEFYDADLTGWLPYDPIKHAQAVATLRMPR